MKVRWLVNENFPAPSVAVMRASGHDVLSISESNSGVDDTVVLALACDTDRWLVTFDRMANFCLRVTMRHRQR